MTITVMSHECHVVSNQQQLDCLFKSLFGLTAMWNIKTMGLCKKDVTPLLMHWSYIFLALSHRKVHNIPWSLCVGKPVLSGFPRASNVESKASPCHDNFVHKAGQTDGQTDANRTMHDSTDGRWRLTHLPFDEMAAISQTIFSDTFFWMKSFVFWLKFHRSLFLRV